MTSSHASNNIANDEEITEEKSGGCLLSSLFIIFGFIAVMGVYLLATDWFDLFESTPKQPQTTQEIRKEQIDKSFSAWDGSHRELSKLIKKNMNDPSSYEHVKTLYGDRGDFLLIETTFRGKNTYGALVLNTVRAKYDLEGHLIEIISQK